MLDHREKPGSPTELAHYGVKGMRWGVRKKEDTGGDDGTSREEGSPSQGRLDKLLDPITKNSDPEKQRAKAEKFMQNADVLNTRISELRAENAKYEGAQNPAKLYAKYANNEAIKTLDKAQKDAVADAERARSGKLTKKQKQVVYGALAVGGVLAGGILLSKITAGQQSGAFNSYKHLARARLTGQKVPFNTNKDLTGPMSVKDLLTKVAKPVNPLYSTPGGHMNCRRSTYAYELRRRGFDVRATTSAVGWGQSESGVINAVTPGAKNFYDQMSLSTGVVQRGYSARALGDYRQSPLKKTVLENLLGERPPLKEISAAIAANGGTMPAHMQKLIDNAGSSSSHKVLTELAKQGNGARGEVMFRFPGFGHSMAYEIVDGKAHIFDSQKGTLYNAATKMVESKWDGFHSAEITRLDNVDLDLNFLSRWAANTK